MAQTRDEISVSTCTESEVVHVPLLEYVFTQKFLDGYYLVTNKY